MYNSNHPYFKKANNENNNALTQVEHNMPVSEDNYNCCYNPAIINPNKRNWLDDPDRITRISRYTDFSKYDAYGYEIGSDGSICDFADNVDASYGVIMASPFTSITDKDGNNTIMTKQAAIVNTEDSGLRYITFNQNGSVSDLGPVKEACLIGNRERAEGIYIPLCNIKAMADASIVIDGIIKSYVKEADKDIIEVEEF